MLDNLFPFMDASDDDVFAYIGQVEALFETQEQFEEFAATQLEGNTYELHLLLQSLKSGEIDFKNFMDKAMVWSNVVMDDTGKPKAVKDRKTRKMP